MAQTTDSRSRTPTLAEVIRAAMEYRLADVHVSLPGRIESYDAQAQKADVKPLIKRRLATIEGEELLEDLPVLPDVPVVFPRAGGFFFTLPIKKGDHVLIVFNERSTDNFLSSDGADTDPDDFRMHSLADAVAVPGFYPFTKSINETGVDTDLALGKEGGAQVHVQPSGQIFLKPTGGGKVSLGSEAAALAIARVTDKTIADATMTPWIIAVTNALIIVATAFNAAPSGTPVVSGGPGTMVPPILPTDFGLINTGATKSTAD